MNAHDLAPALAQELSSSSLKNRLLELHRTRKKRRAEVPLATSERRVWVASVKEWLQHHDSAPEWELPEDEERFLCEWFHAIDIDRSGTLDVDEIRALLKGSGQDCSARRINRLFKQVDLMCVAASAVWFFA